MSLPKLTPENIIRSIYTSPVNRHKNNLGLVLDLTYITDNIIVCSYPVMKYPRMFYRNSLKDLVTYLNVHHGSGKWKIFNLKVEICDSDYTDEDILSMVGAGLRSPIESLRSPRSAVSSQSYALLTKHSKSIGIELPERSSLSTPINPKTILNDLVARRGWIDHFPPPFILLEEITDEIHEYLGGDSGRVAVVHCKMGKGRSGTVAIAYLMKYRQIPMLESCQLFLTTRFKPGISRGVTIYSQLRYLRYHETFICYDTLYRPQIMEELRRCRFRIDSIEFVNPLGTITRDIIGSACMLGVKIQKYKPRNDGLVDLYSVECDEDKEEFSLVDGKYIILPRTTIDTSDIRLCFGLRSKTTEFINSVTKLTSSAYCWLNLYWETVSCSRSLSPTNFLITELDEEIRSNIGQPTFTIKWEDLEGTKGTLNKGLKLFDSLTLYWSLETDPR
ncbi:AGR341Cp [Eremothecium gossypii ATCC 10895]|uniref:phosphatidylinositol-3,4,5-trisphosphate 3-phosphatase n=1 Tax=Eremothecium gossypii (strain ATCC 10895 / CBS 109.51 / FGSC 9923 / NRRL Y-1056) TaxID=284811 RepID=Q74Z65_EREGS|nr:AGR341Cp [Eremothecium gossypii ATCC 10895]AAS54831.1 AGR341Cp [Eremothecium gossypii ATCC 10895]AEY99163.1 FAGR341Cp [Eremothecium gossypii FDAG1]